MIQTYFSEEEWLMLLQAPMQAIVALTLADKTDPVSFLKESQAGIQILAAEQQREDIRNDLIRAVVEALNAIDQQDPLQGDELLIKKHMQMLQQIQSLKNAAEGLQNALTHFNQISTILDQKVPTAQAAELKTWLLSIAQQVAEAVREKGLFGVGISDAEASTLRKIEKALDFKA
ncbi:hypothetical protein [Egbenema bharatensis]|uniref:hypothetical protein n=1 Tax=Egbenema bharatensis TaxID=3463334 RepID=UPI003A85258F